MGAKTLLTVEQFEQLPETEGVSHELDQGDVIEVPYPSMLHGLIRDEVASVVRVYCRENGVHGRVVVEQAFQLGPDTIRVPDVAFIAAGQLPLVDLQRSVQPFAPALAVEITSPSNTYHELARKTQQYLAGGTKAVWILETAMRQIHVHRAGADSLILSAEHLLEDAALLPGFGVRVGLLFDV